MLICLSSQGVWTVQSQDGTKEYNVTENSAIISPCCYVVCSDCGICVHQYDCTCTDGLISGTICKHVHFVCLKNGNDKASISVYKQRPKCTANTVIHSLATCSNVASNSNSSISQVKEKCFAQLSNLHTSIEKCQDKDTVMSTLKKLKEVEALLELCPVISTSISSTKVSCSQKGFYKTTKKRKPTKYIHKPTSMERQQIKESIVAGEIYDDGK